MKLSGSILEELWFDEEDSHQKASNEAADSFAARLAEVEGVKTFPVVAQKILAILSRPEFRAVEVTRALEEDPALASAVLRMANSAFFAGTNPVSSIDQAFVRLGGRSVREVVAAVATMDLFPETCEEGKVVRDHCASVAAIVQYLAREYAPAHTDGIFLCGLLHDIGKLLLIESQEIIYKADDTAELLTPDTMHIKERYKLGYDHAVLSGHVLNLWKLPEPIPKVVAWHHQPARAFQTQNVGAMVALLRIADQIDFQLFNNNDQPEQWVDELVRSGAECDFIGLKASSLKNDWHKLFEARQDAQSMFAS